MAALRSALARAMVSRRFSGSSAIAHLLVGRGLEIKQVFRHAAPPIHPAAIRNLGCRRFSTGVRDPTGKAESGLRMWWQRAENRVKNASMEDKVRVLFVYTLVVLGTPLFYVGMETATELSSLAKAYMFGIVLSSFLLSVWSTI